MILGPILGIWGQTLHFWSNFGPNVGDFGSNFAFSANLGLNLCTSLPIFALFPPFCPQFWGFLALGSNPAGILGAEAPNWGRLGGGSECIWGFWGQIWGFWAPIWRLGVKFELSGVKLGGAELKSGFF